MNLSLSLTGMASQHNYTISLTKIIDLPKLLVAASGASSFVPGGIVDHRCLCTHNSICIVTISIHTYARARKGREHRLE